MQQMLAISIGALLGANLRYALFQLGARWLPDLPLGTFMANMLGTFGLALFVTLVAPRTTLSPELRLLVATGFFGSLTTFSTFSTEIVALAQRQQIGAAVGYLVASIVAGLGAVLLGILAGTLLDRFI